MTSDSKSLSIAAISGEQWQFFKRFVEWTVAKGDSEVPHMILYSCEQSKSWFFEFFLSKGRPKGSSVKESKESWILSARGERIIARLRDISAEVLAPLITSTDDLKSTIASFGSDHNQCIKYMKHAYDMTKWRIIQDVAAFHVYSLQEKELKGMQRDILVAFGSSEVFHEVGKYFSFNFFIHIGRYLGFPTVPKRTSFAFAFNTYVYRCLCHLVHNNYAEPSKFPKVEVDSKTSLVSYGENEFNADDGIEFVETSSAADVDGGDVVESIVETGWNSNSSEARVLRLFALKHWYDYCIVNHNSFSKYGLMGEAMQNAVDEYNLHCKEMKVAPIDTPLMKSAAKRCAESNWLDKLTSTAKDGIGQESIDNLSATSSLEPLRPEGDPIQDWLPNAGHYHDQNDRRGRWISFYSWHLMKLKTSSTISLSRKRKSAVAEIVSTSDGKKVFKPTATAASNKTASSVDQNVSSIKLPQQPRFAAEDVQPQVLLAKLPAVALSATVGSSSTSTAGGSDLSTSTAHKLASLLTRDRLLRLLEGAIEQKIVEDTKHL
jgi:hypothetical protein